MLNLIKTRGAITFIDDDINFLNSLRLEFSSRYPKNAYCFSDQNAARIHLEASLDYMIKQDEIIARMTSEIDSDERLKLALSVLFDPARLIHSEVVFADYSMPGKKNGLEFLSFLNQGHIKRVLMTGEATEILAVKAFNSGAIDRYTYKHTEDLSLKIKQEASREKDRRSDFLRFAFSREFVNVCLNNTTKGIISQLMLDHAILEYIAIPKYEGLLCINKASEVTWMQFESHKTMSDVVSVMRDRGADEASVELVTSRKQIPLLEFAQTDEGVSLSPVIDLSIDGIYSGLAVFKMPHLLEVGKSLFAA